jgi:Raf kinase inhibitor-like YbhB/YbcL family protein
VPGNAKSLAIVVEDPDAPGGLFTHWLVWNIEPGILEVKTASVPTSAVQGRNDFGKIGYGGPCPPSGVHRYVFRVLALNGKLSLQAGANRAEFDRALAGHIVSQGELTARFGD